MSTLNVRFSLLAVGLIVMAVVLGIIAGLILSHHYPDLMSLKGSQIQVEHLALAAFVFVGLSAIGLYGYLDRSLKPISTLRDQFARVRAGDLEVRLVEDGPTELLRLARAFNDTVRSMEVQVQDVVEAKEEAARSAQFLREQVAVHERFAAVIESVPFSVVVTDHDLLVVYVNPAAEGSAAEHSFSAAGETLVGNSVACLLSDSSPVLEVLSDAQRLPHAWSLSTGSGSVEFQACALTDSEGNFSGLAISWHPVEHVQIAPDQDVSALSGEETDLDGAEAAGELQNNLRLQRSVRLVGRSVQLLSDRITTVQSMVEALGNEGDNLGRCLEETRHRTRNAARLTSERSEVLWRLVQEAIDFAERRRSSGAALRRLRKRLEEMEGLRESVSHLANTMESMVLNARIEFGREAEATSGLRVIVDEIQNLGRDAGRMSKDVEAKIGRVRTDVDEFLNLMDDERRGNRLGGRLGRRAERILERVEDDLQDVDARAELLAEITFAHTEIGSQVADQLGKLFELVQVMVPVTREQARIVRASTGEADDDDPNEESSVSAGDSRRSDFTSDLNWFET